MDEKKHLPEPLEELTPTTPEETAPPAAMPELTVDPAAKPEIGSAQAPAAQEPEDDIFSDLEFLKILESAEVPAEKPAQEEPAAAELPEVTEEAPAEEPAVEEAPVPEAVQEESPAENAETPEAEEAKPESLLEDADGWFDDLLKSPDMGKEIGEDKHAESIGLSHISDLELEKIIQETMSDDWTVIAQEEQVLEPPAPMQEPIDESDEFLNPSFYTDNGEMPEEEEDEDYEEEEEPEEEEEEPEVINGVLRKVRPRRKNSYGLFGIPHLLSVAIWALITVTIGISLGRLVWVCASDVLAFGRVEQKVTITITNSDTMDTIVDKLHKAGLIKYPSLFRIYADLANAEKKISVGTFDLNTLYDYHALVGGMTATSSYRKQVEVMIPEGYTCAQIFALLEEKGVCSAAKLEDFCINGEIRERWFLEGVKRDNKYCLEGFLSPDTYKFYTDDTPSRVIGKFLDAFGAKLDSLTVDVRTQLDDLNTRLSEMMKKRGYGQDYIDSHQLSFRDLLTVASMIEKESANSAESYTVSAVIYNRLSNPEYPRLQIDATIVYALGGKNPTPEDKEIDHPYNTYKVEGLPPGPISNPGLTSLYAALDPDEEDYYYYALNPATGLHHFSKTYREHQQFLESLG